MKVVVLGAGVIGVTSAYYLAKAGDDVIVVDRRDGPAMETSFANAGEISPGYASPWAAPGIPLKALKWLFMRHAPLVLRPTRLDWQAVAWIGALLRNCTNARYALNKTRMVRLAEFSRDRLIDLRGETGIEYDQRTHGTLQLFRTQKQLDGVGKDIEVLRAAGVPFQVLDRTGCVALEPGLRGAAEQITGGLHLPNDETGDCFMFATELVRLSIGLGVDYQLRTRIERLELERERISVVKTDRGEIQADAFVLCLGSFSSKMVHPLGLRLPVYPVKGYSITIPIVDELGAPQS